MARRPINKPADKAPEVTEKAPEPAKTDDGTIKVQLITPYPQVMPVTGIRFLPNDPVIVPNNAWVQNRIKDEMLIEVK